MKFIEISKLKSKQSEYKLDLILDVLRKHYEMKGLDYKFNTTDFQILSCIFNVPSGDIKIINKGFQQLLINPL
jgi:hypothetical protein